MSTSVVLGVEASAGVPARMIACREALDEAGASAEWRAALGERTGLRADLPDCTTLWGWAQRAGREMLRVVFTDGSIHDVAHAGDLNVALIESHFARSVYDSTGSDGEGGRVYREVTLDGVVERTTDRQTTYTDLTLTTKEAQACPAETCGGWLHPVTFTCGRCGGNFPEGGEVGVREDVANRYEPKVKGFYHIVFGENGEAVSLTPRTLTRRKGSDKAGLNPESWEIFARWERGGKPAWAQQAFGLVAVQGNDGTTFLPVAFHREQAAAAREWGITIQGNGPNMGIREVTE